MQRITKKQKQIADAHIAAKQAKKFDDPVVADVTELVKLLAEGKTFSKVLDEIETRFTSITSMILASTTFNHLSHAYKQGVYKGFKILLTAHKIV